MSNRLEYSKICAMLESDCSEIYQNRYVDRLKTSVPSVFQQLEPMNSFVEMISIMKSISIQATEFVDKYFSLNNDSFNNRISH